ncbi:MAG TPA: hypothetical protein VF550_14935, partial [Polyangia bacterium]
MSSRTSGQKEPMLLPDRFFTVSILLGGALSLCACTSGQSLGGSRLLTRLEESATAPSTDASTSATKVAMAMPTAPSSA